MIYYHFNIPTVGPFRCADTHMRKENNLLEFTKSLIKILKNNGPKIEPCGIPVLISNNSEVIFSYCTY